VEKPRGLRSGAVFAGGMALGGKNHASGGGCGGNDPARGDGQGGKRVERAENRAPGDRSRRRKSPNGSADAKVAVYRLFGPRAEMSWIM
jgi:hypothetical protein